MQIKAYQDWLTKNSYLLAISGAKIPPRMNEDVVPDPTYYNVLMYKCSKDGTVTVYRLKIPTKVGARAEWVEYKRILPDGRVLPPPKE